MLEFSAQIQRPPGTGTWHFITIPFDTAAHFGRKGQVRVKGALNGVAFQSTLLPDGEGGHYLVVGHELREQAGVGQGDLVEVRLEKDDAPRTVELLPEFQAALDANPVARAAFEKMAPSHRKRYADAIAEAKKPETRQRRIEQTIKALEG